METLHDKIYSEEGASFQLYRKDKKKYLKAMSILSYIGHAPGYRNTLLSRMERENKVIKVERFFYIEKSLALEFLKAREGRNSKAERLYRVIKIWDDTQDSDNEESSVDEGFIIKRTISSIKEIRNLRKEAKKYEEEAEKLRLKAKELREDSNIQEKYLLKSLKEYFKKMST